MFDIDELIDDCKAAVTDADPRGAVRDVLTRALQRPDEVAGAVAQDAAGLQILHNAPELTVLNVTWAPRMAIYPHDHRMAATIGIYGGAEANTLYRRGSERIQKAGGRLLERGDVLSLGSDAIHHVENPRDTPTGAIHVYAGDFVNAARSQWDPDTLVEQPYDLALFQRLFAEANERWRRQLGHDLDETTA
jgi:predicted metal-dependent enzyme (double-stranded beta helix superfamily)